MIPLFVIMIFIVASITYGIILINSNVTLVQTANLVASDTAANDYFGSSVSMSADGTVALVGSFSDDTDSAYDTGSAYIFESIDGEWRETTKLVASDTAAADYFGSSVSMSADGTVALVGSFSDDTDSAYDTGSAYIFESIDGEWRETTKLVASDTAANDYFGSSVSMSADGTMALVGSRVDDASTGIGAGSAYIFESIDGEWRETTKLVASDTAAADYFGSSVSMSADGTVALVGSFSDDTDSAYDTGSAYIFESIDGEWRETTKLVASDTAANDYFGSSVSMSADGTMALVGSRVDDASTGIGAGSAYIFENTSGEWRETTKLVASDTTRFDYFGSSVSMSADGTMALVGSSGYDTDSAYDTGSAYIFESIDGEWRETTKLVASDTAANDYFGSSVSMSADGTMALVGSRVDDASTGIGAGSVYVFTLKP